MIILAAPLQGYTEGIWRLAHAGVFEPYSGTPDAYCAPFLRVEKGDVRARDIRDLSLSATGPVATVPQIIFRDIEEFRLLKREKCTRKDMEYGEKTENHGK